LPRIDNIFSAASEFFLSLPLVRCNLPFHPLALSWKRPYWLIKIGAGMPLQIVKIPDREIFSEEDKSSHTGLIFPNFQIVNLAEFLPHAWHGHCQDRVEPNPGHELPGLLKCDIPEGGEQH
jgi:hypothetical protein